MIHMKIIGIKEGMAQDRSAWRNIIGVRPSGVFRGHWAMTPFGGKNLLAI